MQLEQNYQVVLFTTDVAPTRGKLHVFTVTNTTLKLSYL